MRAIGLPWLYLLVSTFLPLFRSISPRFLHLVVLFISGLAFFERVGIDTILIFGLLIDAVLKAGLFIGRFVDMMGLLGTTTS